MTLEIPPDFGKPWSMSDVVLHTNNSDGKDIYAYKGVLAVFSPYFRALFFGDFKEKNDDSVNVDCDYDVMLEILRNIHQIGFKYAVAQRAYSSEMLAQMYRAADLYDFAVIRNMCVDHMETYANIEMAKAAGNAELYDLRMSILMKLSPEDVYKYLRFNTNYFLNKEEFLVLFQKVVGGALPKPVSEKSRGLLNLEEVTEDLKNPRVDLTKPWAKADLMIITNNFMGRVLYANKAVVEMMCSKIGKIAEADEADNKIGYFCPAEELHLDSPGMSVARIDEEYAAVKEILSIIHMCNTDYEKERSLHPALLHSMYVAADKNHLDISLMASEVPPDFDEPWSLSDIVLHANNSDGKDIYACKTALAMFSPYFRVLFFGDFQQKKDTSMTVDCDYDVMLEILRNIHQIGFKYCEAQKRYSSEILVRMYQAADLYDFPFIRNMCLEHMEVYASDDMLKAVTSLELYDHRAKILNSFSFSTLTVFLSSANFTYILTKEELLVIFEKLFEGPLPKPTEGSDQKPSGPLNLEDVSDGNPRVDLTKSWPIADLAILTKNSRGRLLYANIAVIDSMWPNFHENLCTADELALEVNASKKYMARVDEDFTTIKEILTILQISKADSEPDRLLHPALLHSMYCAAGEDRLDIPVIRNTCVSNLVQHRRRLGCALATERDPFHVETDRKAHDPSAPRLGFQGGQTPLL